MRLAISAVLGVAAGIVASRFVPSLAAGLAGWDVFAAVFLGWIASTVMRYGPEETARHASTEDPSRAVADVVLIAASTASLVGVGFVFFSGQHHGLIGDVMIAIGVLTIALSWSMVHTLFALHYARLFFGSAGGGIDFNASEEGEGRPCYVDFAYVAFTVGMTFQVSDTNMRTHEIRRAVLHHALLSYLIGAVVLSMLINLIAGMSK